MLQVFHIFFFKVNTTSYYSKLRRVFNDFWLKNKHSISIFQAEVRDLAKHVEAQSKKQNAYKKERVSLNLNS